MAKYLVERSGAGKYEVGSIVELTTSEAEFYRRKIKLIPEPKPEPKIVLEVATPAAQPKRKPRSKKQTQKKPLI